MNRRGQLIVLAFLVAILAYLVIAWRSQSTENVPKNPGLVSASPEPSVDPTRNWATFTSTDPAFTVKYPAGWAVLKPDLPAVISNKTSLDSRTPDTLFLLADSRPGTSLNACYAISQYGSGYDYTSKSVKVAGRAASVYTINAKPGSGKTGYATAYLLIGNGRCYDITLASMTPAARDQNAGLAQTIAGSLKFK